MFIPLITVSVLIALHLLVLIPIYFHLGKLKKLKQKNDIYKKLASYNFIFESFHRLLLKDPKTNYDQDFRLSIRKNIEDVYCEISSLLDKLSRL